MANIQVVKVPKARTLDSAVKELELERDTAHQEKRKNTRRRRAGEAVRVRRARDQKLIKMMTKVMINSIRFEQNINGFIHFNWHLRSSLRETHKNIYK